MGRLLALPGPGRLVRRPAYEVSYNRPYDGNGAVKLLAFEIGQPGPEGR